MNDCNHIDPETMRAALSIIAEATDNAGSGMTSYHNKEEKILIVCALNDDVPGLLEAVTKLKAGRHGWSGKTIKDPNG